MASNNLAAKSQKRNVPIQSRSIVLKDELVRTSILPNRISKKKIEELAIQKYKTCGKGIDFADVMQLQCSKNKAQRILKHCCRQIIGRDGSRQMPILFRSPKRTRPQRYYPSKFAEGRKNSSKNNDTSKNYSQNQTRVKVANYVTLHGKKISHETLDRAEKVYDAYIY